MLYSLHTQLVIAEHSQVHFPKFLRYLVYKAVSRKLKKKLLGKHMFVFEQLPCKYIQGAIAQELSFWV